MTKDVVVGDTVYVLSKAGPERWKAFRARCLCAGPTCIWLAARLSRGPQSSEHGAHLDIKKQNVYGTKGTRQSLKTPYYADGAGDVCIEYRSGSGNADLSSFRAARDYFQTCIRHSVTVMV